VSKVPTETTRKIGAAIAGCGQIARTRHAPEYHANPNAEIIGFYDENHSRAQELAQQYGCKAYDSFEDLLADKNVEAVSICTPNSLHSAHTIQALEAGKDVLCEKPMASTVEEAQRMIDAQRKTGRILMLGHNQRLVRTHIRAKELLEAGAIGDILSIQTNFKHSGPESWSVERGNTWFFSKTKAAFGVLGDLGSHKLDLVRYLLGDEIQSIFATLQTLDKRDGDGNLIDLEDNAICVFKMRGGIPGTMIVSWTNYGVEDNSTVIYGTKGTMKIFASELDDIVVDLRDGTSARHHVSQMSTNTNQLSSGIIDAFLKTILEGGEPPVTGLDGRNTLACLEAAQKSSATGTWIEVDLG
jgi:predicted dehydrogenase